MILNIHKPIGWTSFDVVKKIRGIVREKKVGHGGTLDPFAEGVLMLCTGEFTKKVESFMNKEKEYIADIQLGIETDTLDPTGNIVKTANIPDLSKEQIKMVLKIFIGNIKQEPPMFSAIKVNGQPLYRFARKGIIIPRKKRVISIHDIELIDFSKDVIMIKVTCGRGTYIRSLAKDIAEKLNTVGHLAVLKRTRIGEYDIKRCIEVEDFPEWISART